MQRYVTLAVLFGTSLAAHAASVLVTPPLSMPSSGHFMECVANNLDDDPRTITVEILNTVGSPIVRTSGIVNPGGIRGVATGNLFTSYCRITYSGSKKFVRGQMTLNLNGTPVVPQATVPAQVQ